MARVLAVQPSALHAELGRSSVTVQRWRHDALHGETRGMADHVVMAYLGTPRAIARRDGRRRAAGWTRRTSLTIIPAGSESHWDIEGDLDCVHAYIPPAALRTIAEENGLRAGSLGPRTARLDERGSQILRMLVPTVERSRPDALFADQAADLLAMHLLTAHMDGGAPPAMSQGGLAPGALRRVREFMEADLAADYGLTCLAGIAGLSVFHFCRAFKQSTGVSPNQWRRLRRLEQASELLRRTNLPIGEISMMVGYDDPSQLARLFKQEIGSTPTSLRRISQRE